MYSFSKEELLKIAKLSALHLDENEIEQFAKELQIILEYSSMLNKVVSEEKLEAKPFKTNVFREDIAIQTDSKEILENAPQKKDTFFVVPKIL